MRAVRWILPVLLGAACFIGAAIASDPMFAITVSGGNAALSWNSTVTGAASIEHSTDLNSWAPLTQNNTAGSFPHATGGASLGFYRLKWNSTPPPTPLPVFLFCAETAAAGSAGNGSYDSVVISQNGNLEFGSGTFTKSSFTSFINNRGTTRIDRYFENILETKSVGSAGEQFFTINFTKNAASVNANPYMQAWIAYPTSYGTLAAARDTNNFTVTCPIYTKYNLLANSSEDLAITFSNTTYALAKLGQPILYNPGTPHSITLKLLKQ
jgi:hypothetical protein